MKSGDRATRLALGVAVTLVAAAVGCSGSSDAPAPRPQPLDAFVVNLIQNRTADDTEPVELDGLDLDAPIGPNAFDVLFP